MRSFTHWRWHLDEVDVKINDEAHYLGRAVDHEGEGTAPSRQACFGDEPAADLNPDRFAPRPFPEDDVGGSLLTAPYPAPEPNH